MIMLWTDVLSCLQRGNTESQRLLKSIDDVQDLGPAICGFANGKGGLIILGIDFKNYHLLGTPLDSKAVMEMVHANFTAAPQLEINPVRRGDRVVLTIKIAESSKKPVYFNRQAYLISTVAPFAPEVFVPTQPTTFHVLSTPVSSDSETSDTVGSDAVAIHAPAKWDREQGNLAEDVTMNTRQRKSMDYLTTHAFISNKSYRAMFDISHKTAHLELVDLVNKGILIQQGNGRSTSYKLATSAPAVVFAVA